MKFSFFGDTHGNLEQFKAYQKEGNYDALFHVGDFSPEPQDWHDFVSYRNSKTFIVTGNHEDFPTVKALRASYPNYSGILHGSGLIELGNKNAFYISGGISMNKMSKDNYSPEEEIEGFAGIQLLDYFDKLTREVKIDLIVSHSAPRFIARDIITCKYEHFISSFTESLLEEIWHIHQPDLWVCGHYHEPFVTSKGDTQFQALGKNEVVEFVTD